MSQEFICSEYDLENLVLTKDERHISALSFSSKGARVLEGAKKWDIPTTKFCVLTGNNGSGKTHLLEYIHKLMLKKEKDKTFGNSHVYIRSNHDNETWNSLKFRENSSKVGMATMNFLVSTFAMDEKEYDEIMDNDELSKIHGDYYLDDIKEILERYNFNFNLEEIKEASKSDYGLKRKDLEGSKIVKPNQISSGEREILSILSRFFFTTHLQSLRPAQPQILLLDEPDRHLDPKNIEAFLKLLEKEFVDNGIQVIMTTHRFDTISLGPEKNIFLLYKNKETQVSEIVEVSQKQALYNLTRNLRDMNNIQIKVYSEATSDADFYCGVYHSLLKMSNKQRIMGKTKLEFKGDEIEKYSVNLLSRRYQLLFVPVSFQKDESGGCIQIKLCVSRDQNILLNKKKAKKESEKVIFDTRTYNSLGLIDNDNKRDQYIQGLQEKGLGKFIVIPKERHSLENFILDPIILCSSWDPFSIEDNASHIEENKTSENNTKKNKNLNQQNQNQSSTEQRQKVYQKQKEERKIFVKVCDRIKKELQKIENETTDPNQNSNVNIEALQLYLKEYFKLLEPIFTEFEKRIEKREEIVAKKARRKTKAEGEAETPKNSEPLRNNEKEKESRSDDKLTEVRQPTLPSGFQKIGVFSLNGSNRIFTVEYPKEFLKIRGHDLADLLMSSMGVPYKKFIAERASDIYANELTWIPEEIAEAIFNLNKSAKEQNKEDKSYKKK